MDLTEEDNEKAISAHQAYADVEITGSLIQRGPRTYLLDARGVKVLPAPARNNQA